MRRVSSSWEQQTILRQRKCECGGSQIFERSSVSNDVILNQWVDTVDVVCDACGMREAVRFDITEVLSKGDQDPIGKAWPAPHAGDYRVDAASYERSMKSIRAAMEDGTISAEEAQVRSQEAIDATHPKVAGRFQVFGSRAGSMGELYLCVDHQWTPTNGLDYFVICKTFSPGDSVSLEALKQEARVWLDLPHHPNLIRLIDVIQLSDTAIALVMEAVLPGPTGEASLRDWMRNGVLPVPIGDSVARQLVEALTICRNTAAGFVHGDIKPENVLIDVGWRVRLTDMGIAKTTAHSGGSCRGTPMYRAPELWRDGPATAESDIYALGLLLYELYEGHHPFANADDFGALEFQHCTQAPPSPSKIGSGLRELVSRALMKLPTERPTLDEFSSALKISQVSSSQDAAVDLNNRGEMLLQLGDHGKAKLLLREAASLAPSQPAVWLNLGVVHSRLREFAEAELALEFALRLDRSAAALTSYAVLLLRMQDTKRLGEALALLNAALERDPDSIGALVSKMTALNRLGRSQEALPVGERARKLDARNVFVWTELAYSYFLAGRHSKALQSVKSALRLDPEFGPAKRILAHLRSR